MAKGNLKPLPEEEAAKKQGYNPIDDEKKVWEQYLTRKQELQSSRSNVYGLDIDSEMRRFDRMYFRREADIPTSELDPDQKPVAINNAFGKIQTALGILIDRNPKYILDEDNPKFAANRALIKALGEKSFQRTNSLGQFKLSVFNAAKRGWFAGRTHNRQLVHNAKFLTSIDSKGQKNYLEKKIVKLDDVAYTNLSNYNVWFDEQSKPEDFFSTRDWMWREVWHIDDLRITFPEKEFPNMKYVVSGGDTATTLGGTNQSVQAQALPTPQNNKKNLIEVFFYENQFADQYIMEANGVMVVWEPLPNDNKRISGTYGGWHLRADDTIYHIGIVEEMENDEQLADRIINMDMRELLLTIAPMGFYSGTEDPEDENIRITPGILKRVLDPNSIQWTQIPSGNQKGLEKVQWLEEKQDDKTGITRTIQGTSDKTSQTAFEVGVEREAGLKRLRLPLKSLQYALAWEFENRISLIQQVYSDFDVEHIADPDKIQAYLDEVKADPEFYFIENEGVPGEEKFYAKKYRMVSLNLDKNDKGEFIESDIKSFFHLKPEMLPYEGFISVDISSLLIASDELEKANTLRMANVLIPIFQLPKEIGAKPAKALLIANNYDPKKWMPQDWLDFLDGKKAPQPQIPGATPNAQPVQPLIPPAQVESGATPDPFRQ